MILTNDEQYESTGRSAAEFEAALAALEAARPTMDESKYLGLKSGYVRLVGDLRNQMREYGRLRGGEVRRLRSASLGELPRLLIKARIARRLTVKDLAARLGWEASLVERYEEREYETAPWRRMAEVADALKIRVTSDCRLSGADDVPAEEEELTASKS